jgi:ubiquinone/menaquinone biosynthesis C-methylase UbiE
MPTKDHASWGYAASTGLGFTHEEIVEAHFKACEVQYRAALEQADIRAGWRVLDAGCGSGAFLPWLADLVGSRGHVTAIDLAEENASLAAERMRRSQSSCSFDAQQGDLRNLPYEDDTFDAVWCANTTQYLDDDELDVVLREFSRVVRPGGVVAIKDLDASLITARPADPFLFTDFFRHASSTPGYARQLLRTRDLHRWLDEAGLVSVRQKTMLIEHHAPLRPAAQRFYALACARIAQQAIDMGLQGDWQPFLDPDSADNPLSHHDGYISEGNTVAVGLVPPAEGNPSVAAR